MEDTSMEQRYAVAPDTAKTFATDQLRQQFLIEALFAADRINMVYSHYDRMVIGGACPKGPLKLAGDKTALASDSFLARREIGIINVGGPVTSRWPEPGTRWPNKMGCTSAWGSKT
jgi:4-deoxy-L-threo-5-hexosulose-uronate ketol-isomerase